ncbi:DUF885 family protein [Parerythrobacter aurantius]|uniref:DUF885 domain-containing protein n=1 Tax=Parerythrobacter aurantius TaxID=3127706 RepID=UPI00325200BA
MMRRILGALVLGLAAFPQPLLAQDSADQVLQALAEQYRKNSALREGAAIGEGGSLVYSGKLPDVTPAAMQANAERSAELLRQLEAVAPEELSAKAKIDAAVLRTLLQEEIGNARFREWEMPFDSDNNFWSYLAPRGALTTIAEYESYLARLNDVPRYFDENIANARSGLARGFSVPQVTLAGRDVSLAAYVTESAEDSPFWVPFARMPAAIPPSEANRLKAAGKAAIENAVTPAYTRLLAFFREEYRPRARETLAASVMPDGADYYAQQIRQYTTLDLSAEQIHEIGLAEVARITAEMEKVKTEAGFDGSLAEFVQFLRSDPQFVARTPDELMGVASYAAKRVDGKLAQYFGFLPRHRFSIVEVDPAIAPFYTAGRGGYVACQMNTYDLPSRPLYNIPALTLHECAPGHSFQAAVANEQPAAAEFRRRTYFSGFGEGWGLYVEYLGNEMGIYRTPYERFGQLSYEMWRAVRLVIDTGIHHYGWSREQAVDYLATRTALSTHEVNTEVDRYISWPGQALAYKLGEMTMRRVRGKAEAELGDKFDIRKFHDVVLSLGSVPLPVLEERIDAFITDGGQGLDGVKY